MDTKRKTTRLTVHISKSVDTALRHKAKEEDRTLSALVERVLRAYLETSPRI